MAAYDFEGSFKCSLLVIANWGSAGPTGNSTGKIKFMFNEGQNLIVVT